MVTARNALPLARRPGSFSPRGRLVRFTLRRIIAACFLCLGITLVAFVLTHLVPGDPAAAYLGDQGVENKQAVAAFRHQYGLDKPVPDQYFIYLEHLVKGDLGVSQQSHRPVLDDLKGYVPASAELALTAGLIGALLGITLGLVAALFRDRWPDHLLRIGSLAGVSMPTFWLALVAFYLFFFKLGIAPGGGRLTPGVLPPPHVTGFYTIDAALAGQWSSLASPPAPRSARARPRVLRDRCSHPLHPRRGAGRARKRLRTHGPCEGSTGIVSFSAMSSGPRSSASSPFRPMFGTLFSGAVLIETSSPGPVSASSPTDSRPPRPAGDHRRQLFVALVYIGDQPPRRRPLQRDRPEDQGQLMHGVLELAVDPDRRPAQSARCLSCADAVVGSSSSSAGSCRGDPPFSPPIAPFVRTLHRFLPPSREASVRNRRPRARPPQPRPLRRRPSFPLAIIVVLLSLALGARSARSPAISAASSTARSCGRRLVFAFPRSSSRWPSPPRSGRASERRARRSARRLAVVCPRRPGGRAERDSDSDFVLPRRGCSASRRSGRSRRTSCRTSSAPPSCSRRSSSGTRSSSSPRSRSSVSASGRRPPNGARWWRPARSTSRAGGSARSPASRS